MYNLSMDKGEKKNQKIPNMNFKFYGHKIMVYIISFAHILQVQLMYVFCRHRRQATGDKR